MKKFMLFFLLLFTLPLSALAVDTIKLTAIVDNPSPRVGERINYTIQADYTGSLPDIVPPDFDGVEVVGGPSVSTSVQIINMTVSKSQTFSYVLRPTRPGPVTISPASLKLKGRTISSNSVSLDVLSNNNPQVNPTPGKASGNQNQAVAPTGQGDKLPEVFLTAVTDKSTLTKLDMAVVTYKLYLRVNVLNYEVAKLPQATGFWIEEFPVSARPVLEDVTVRGQPYKVATIRKIGVFPTRSGSLNLDPLTVDVTIERPGRRGRDSFFDDPFFGSRGQRVTQSISSDPLSLNVRDFPAGAPASFSGDVGSLEMSVTYDKRELAQNDAITVKVAISGRGYLKSIDAPKLELPSGFEQFAPTVEDNVSLVGEAMRGKKTFTYLVIPRRSGSFKLSPVNFSYYDPGAGSYKTVSGGGLDLTITPAIGSEQNNYSGRSPAEVTLLDSDIRFVKALSTPLTRNSVPPYRSPLFFFLLALAPVAFVGGIGWEKYIEKLHANPVLVRRRKASEAMRKALLEADKFAAERNALKAAETAAKGLSELTCAVIDEPTAGLTIDLVRRRLADLGAEPSLIEQTVQLLGETDRIRFGGSGQTLQDIESLMNLFKETAASLERLK